jgi:hypothetical protein
MSKANWPRLITASVVALLAASVIVLLHRVKPPTAPSFRVVLVGCTNVSMKTARNNPALFPSPLAAPPIQKDAEFKVFNRGDVNRLFQTSLFGAMGTVEPGESRTFIVRFWSMGGSHVGGGGLIQYELRGVCETTPAEPNLRLIKWLKRTAVLEVPAPWFS